MKTNQNKGSASRPLGTRAKQSDEDLYKIVGGMSALLAQLSPPNKLKALRILAFGENQFEGNLYFPSARGPSVVLPPPVIPGKGRPTTVPVKKVQTQCRLAKPLRKDPEYRKVVDELKLITKKTKARKLLLKKEGSSTEGDPELNELVNQRRKIVEQKVHKRSELGIKPSLPGKAKVSSGKSQKKDAKGIIPGPGKEVEEQMDYVHSSQTPIQPSGSTACGGSEGTVATPKGDRSKIQTGTPTSGESLSDVSFYSRPIQRTFKGVWLDEQQQ